MNGYEGATYTAEETARTVAFLRELAAVFEKHEAFLYLDVTQRGYGYDEYQIAVESEYRLATVYCGESVTPEALMAEADKLERGGA